MDDQIAPTRLAAMPVSVADQDRVLVRRDGLFVAVVGVRAYPQAVMFQLLTKARFGGSGDDKDDSGGDGGGQPYRAFGLPHLLRPGNFDFGAESRDAAGDWRPATVHFEGGGGGGGEADGEYHYEFRWWVALAAEDRGLRLWCAWPEWGVPKSAAEFDIDRLHAAARASRQLW